MLVFSKQVFHDMFTGHLQMQGLRQLSCRIFNSRLSVLLMQRSCVLQCRQQACANAGVVQLDPGGDKTSCVQLSIVRVAELLQTSSRLGCCTPRCFIRAIRSHTPSSARMCCIVDLH